MSSDNVFGVEPPKDANGEVIPLDTDILYETDGQVFHVLAFRYSTRKRKWFASGGYTGDRNGWCIESDKFLLTTPDSWDKLIDDLRNSTGRYMAACAYFNPAGEDRDGCQSAGAENCTDNAFTDIADRIEKLRESEAREDDYRLRAIDRDELLKVADECERADVDGVIDLAARIRKAVGE